MTSRTKKVYALSNNQSRVLALLATRTQAQVAAEMNCTRQYIFDVCVTLRKLGMITPEHKPTDRAVLAGILWEIMDKMQQSGPLVAAKPEGV